MNKEYWLGVFLTVVVFAIVLKIALDVMVEKQREQCNELGGYGYHNVTICDYHIPFIGDVACYETQIYCW